MGSESALAKINGGIKPVDLQFIAEYIKNGGNGTKAYQTLHPGTHRDSASSLASQILSKLSVREEVKLNLRALHLDSHYILKNLKQVADNKKKKNRGIEIVKACEAIGKIGGYDNPESGKIEINISGQQVAVVARGAEEYLRQRDQNRQSTRLPPPYPPGFRYIYYIHPLTNYTYARES